MRLILYSGFDFVKNTSLDHMLCRLVGHRRFRITYIPSSSEDLENAYHYFTLYFKKYRVRNFFCLPVDVAFTKNKLKEALKSEVVYLSGGNTYYFLRSLRRSGMIHALRDYVKKGGILAGSSAGSIMMTPNINTASRPSFDRDNNDINLRNLKALNLVRFEFMPHYRNTSEFRTEMIRYSKKLPYPVYACTDGSGILIQDKNTIFSGNVYSFTCGHMYPMSH